MRKNIAAVIAAFKVGEAHTEKTCRTNGKIVWSYNLPIARFIAGGYQILDRGPSRTTNSQINALKEALPRAEHISEIKPY